jgi:hypothetical protein
LLVGYVPHHFHATLETKSTRSIQSGAVCALLATCWRPILNATKPRDLGDGALAGVAHKSRKKELTLFCPDLSPIFFKPLLSGSRAWKIHERFGS